MEGSLYLRRNSKSTIAFTANPKDSISMSRRLTSSAYVT